MKSNAELVVFGDPSQNIFNRERDQYGDINLGAAIGGYWNKDLKKTKRITNPRITELANAFKKEMMNEQVLIETSQERELPFELQYEYQEEIPSSEALVGKICDVITEMDFELKDTVILAQKQSILCDTDYYYRKATNNDTSITFASREEIDYLREVHKIVDGGHVSFQFSQDLRAKDRNKKLAFSMDSRFLKFSTIHSFKGWEANNVILILLPLGIENQETKYTVSEQQNLPALIYTGITRAKENFYILNFGNKEYKEFFENNMNVL